MAADCQNFCINRKYKRYVEWSRAIISRGDPQPFKHDFLLSVFPFPDFKYYFFVLSRKFLTMIVNFHFTIVIVYDFRI